MKNYLKYNEDTKDLLFQKTVHFIGVGGAGMIALAQYLRAFGQCKVTGSDLKSSSALDELATHGFLIYKEHKAEQVHKASYVVYSTAIKEDNPELAYAKDAGIPCFQRSEFLAFLMKDYKQIVSVAGTHGKTTSTGLAIHILDSAGIIPSFMIGGELTPYYMNGRYSQSSTFVAEADESDGSFLNLVGHYGLITNIDLEHMNYYKTEENLFDNFLEYAQSTLEKNGFLAINKDDERSCKLYEAIDGRSCNTFSLSDSSADLFASDIQFTAEGSSFTLFVKQKELGQIRLNLFGRHNVSNALAVITLMLKLNVPFSHIQKGCLSFKGVKRRMQLIGKVNGASIYDDYGHHPTEVAATLSGIRSVFDGHLICVFQPHRISRLTRHLEAFKSAFKAADEVILSPIYTAQEQGDCEALISELSSGIESQSACKVRYLQEFSHIQDTLKRDLKEDHLLITMGAGDISKVAHQLVEREQQLEKTV